MPWETFEELEQYSQQLLDEGQYAACITLYESELEHFPAHLPEMISALALAYLAHGNKKKALAMLSAGLERGYFFALPPDGLFFQKLGTHKGFQTLLAYNQKLQKIASQNAQPQWVITIPNGYDPLRLYPLFLTLHGYGANIPMMQHFWHAPRLRDHFIHAFLQSSQAVDLKNFAWQDPGLARQEIQQMASEITDQYAVGLDQIFIGGFGQGATLGIELAVSQALPIRGFIALCPQRPANVQPQLLKNVQEIGLSGVILTGEDHTELSDQQEMAGAFRRAHIPCQFKVISGLGHGFPADLPNQLNQALHFLQEQT